MLNLNLCEISLCVKKEKKQIRVVVLVKLLLLCSVCKISQFGHAHVIYALMTATGI